MDIQELYRKKGAIITDIERLQGALQQVNQAIVEALSRPPPPQKAVEDEK